MTRRSDAEKIVDYISDDARAILDLVIESQDLQWQAPRRRAEFEGPKPKGVFSDPVPQIVLDERRLGVRQTRTQALESLIKAHKELERVRSNLTRAIERWRE